MNKAFFLDRDGTINVDYNYVHKPEEWTWCNGVIDALRWIQNHDFKIIVLTNQSGIARGRYSADDVERLHIWVDKQLKSHSISVDDWFYAAHHPEHDQEKNYDPKNRKPNTGMFRQAAQKFDIDFNKSYMAGDKITDLKPAIELGITPIFIRSRHEPRQDKNWLKKHKINTYDTLKKAVDRLANGASI